MIVTVRRSTPENAFLSKRISLFARDSQDVREKRD
jgi:hypothetical protein